MRKILLFFALAMILCLVPLFSALAQTGYVTVDALNIRASASTDSNVVGVAHAGDKVTIKDTTGSWYRISCNGKSGYVYKKYVSVSSGSSSGSSSSGSSSSGSSSSGGTCQIGDNGDHVRKVQKRLIALGYLSGSADGSFGNMTKDAVKAFQQNNGLKVTGKVNSTTLDRLNSSSAVKAGSKASSSSSSSSSSDGTCSPGDTGDAVRKVQKRLIKLGYLEGSADGDYGNMTKNAVKAFQKRNGLSVTGSVNSKTLAKLNSSDAKKAVSDSSSSGGTEKVNWFNGGSNAIPHHAVFKVKDCKTGKVFTCKRWTGYNHMDVEPYSYSDTQTILSIVGHWTWKRRPVLVKYNGHVYAASMNAMPHGTSTISNNGFDGHFCIHFYKSKTHASDQVDSEHQKCVEEASYYSW